MYLAAYELTQVPLPYIITYCTGLSLHCCLLHTDSAYYITIYEERIIVFYGRAIPAICVTKNATQLESQKGASKHSH